MHTLASRDASVTMDLTIGHIVRLVLSDGVGCLSPLHRAPWADDDRLALDSVAPGVAGLSGDFFCAPFGPADVDGAPGHGWSANSGWTLARESHDGSCHTATFELDRPIMGAQLSKSLTLRDGQPFLYQSHRFTGGKGHLPVAHHPMVHVETSALLSVSPKAWAETPAIWDEVTAVLAYPALSEDLRQFPGPNGEALDLTCLPLAATNEDFVMLVEMAGASLGWSALARASEGDTIVFLKDPGMLPVTMIWTSNGGRSGAPWNGRHRGVVGIEDAASFSLEGHVASIEPNALSARGIATSIVLTGTGVVDVRHVIGAFRRKGPPQTVKFIASGTDTLTVTQADGVQNRFAFDGTFLSPHD